MIIQQLLPVLLHFHECLQLVLACDKNLHKSAKEPSHHARNREFYSLKLYSRLQPDSRTTGL